MAPMSSVAAEAVCFPARHAAQLPSRQPGWRLDARGGDRLDRGPVHQRAQHPGGVGPACAAEHAGHHRARPGRELVVDAGYTELRFMLRPRHARLKALPGYAADVANIRREARAIMEQLGYSAEKPLNARSRRATSSPSATRPSSSSIGARTCTWRASSRSRYQHLARQGGAQGIRRRTASDGGRSRRSRRQPL